MKGPLIIVALAAALLIPVLGQDAPSQMKAPAAAEAVSIWTGIANQEQADRAKTTYSGNCAKCHGRNGNGAGEPDQPESPSIARGPFLTKWEGQSLADLFEYVRTTMPQDNPGSRTDQEYIDAIVHMLVLSDVPLADAELPPDPEILAGYTIDAKPAEQAHR